MTNNTDKTDTNATSESNTPNSAQTKKGLKFGEMLLEGESQTWRVKAEKTAIYPFPLNIIIGLFRLLSGKKISGELIFTNERVIYVFKSVTFWFITEKEAYECIMFPRVSLITACVDHALFGLSKRNSITINEQNKYFFKSVDIASLEKQITLVLDQVKK